ncbi:hypothetical protein B0T10DRAFT_481870 [Thelonectria olida]|uniref:DUF1754-domain-containing protein n=1 Tax=Thelonectria olida TaxID=1576542 RepID=A0A9P8W9I3_9HYPO|nr:hypothetical protein B0T10DRAFT_481870 [Thelonectria olida]
MGSDEYAAVGGGGALKLKGVKVHKKKKKRDKSDLEKNLGTDLVKTASDSEGKKKNKPKLEKEAEVEEEDDYEGPVERRTESERRHEEIKRKRLLGLTDTKGGRPELLKTHKERVEELNTYLSRLSEHHDMPRIGPG